MARGSTLNFKKESAAFARALQTEHSTLNDLLAALAKYRNENTDYPLDKVQAAAKAYEDVRFQRTRTEAARGQRFDAAPGITQ